MSSRSSSKDGIVEGTSGDDLINGAYTGDPEGDKIDANDYRGGDNDSVTAGAGDDTVYAGDGNDTVLGEAGDDVLSGDAGNNFLSGGAGNDTFIGGDGADSFSGGSGTDIIDYSNSDAAVNVNLTTGALSGGDAANDSIVSGVDGAIGTDYGDSLVGFDDFSTSTSDGYTNLFYGEGGNDTIDGKGGDDSLYGGAGNDSIDGGSGNDSIEGGGNDDTINGGQGNDTILGDGTTEPGTTPITITIKTGSASYTNKIFVYSIDPVTGDVGDIQMLTSSAVTSEGTTYTYDIPNGSTFGVGIVSPQGTFYSSSSTLNGDGDVHSVVTGTNATGTTTTVGFEDLYNLGDADYNDVVLNVNVGTSGSTFINNGVAYSATTTNANSVAGDDLISAGDGDDLVDGGAGDDTIYGENGADTLRGGLGDDSISGGEQKDSIEGGDGNDSLDGGNDDDTVDGGAGDDTILGGEGNDSLLGGDGADSISGGGGQDTISGGDGNDTIDGGDGDDSIDGGGGDDSITGGTGQDTISGGDGNDTVDGGDGDDKIDGGDGNDSLSGGQGQDSIDGGAGDDTITGGSGVDTLIGGADDDTFIVTSVDDANHDTIIGSETGTDWDKLDLSALDPSTYKVVYTNIYESGGNTTYDGYVNFFDSNHNNIGSMNFEQIEEIIGVVPCFTPGTLIATPKGERLVEELQIGDRVITRDDGIQEIRWIGRRDMSNAELIAGPHLRPVLIAKGSLGNGLPERDMMVSPNHRMLIANDRASLYFDEREVLVAAKHLVGRPGVTGAQSLGVSYLHFMFDRHEVVLADGSWTESFQPGDQSLNGLGAAQRDELLEIFPELRTETGKEKYHAARRTLRKHEARLLLAR